jgi:small nuclear ribonucleoprotein (snRNP)-like protein
VILNTLKQGKLKGFDQNVNVILVESQERVFSTTEGVEIVPLGLYIVRGDNMYALRMATGCCSAPCF